MMYQRKTLIDIEEYQKMILQFIGTEDYKRLLDATYDSKECGFIHGLALSAILMTTRCRYYVVSVPVNNKEETDG